MNINTKLQDEKVLFAKYKNTHSKAKIIQSFNRLGIKTVKDLINADPSIFTDLSRDQYIAFQNIFRHEYLDEPFAYDYIFEKKYNIATDLVELANDIKKLGIVKDTCYFPIHLSSYLSQFNYKDTTIDMETLLKLSYYGKRDLATYYVDRLSRNYVKEATNSGITSEYNRMQINTLTTEIRTYNQVLSDLNYRIENNPSRSLFEFREYLEITVKEKQNQLNALLGEGYTRTRN